MKFGKLQDISKVDFSLPTDPSGTTQLLASLPINPNPLNVYVGCTGWSMKEWIGKIYPKGTKTNQYLHHYARQFNTIELNTTHYRIPKMETIQTWKKNTPDDFKFAPKIPQSISHSRDLSMNTNYTELFCESIFELGENLGCTFMQMSPYFDIKRLVLLEQFLIEFPKVIPLAIEIRHETWFNNSANSKRLFDLLEAHEVSTVITDVAGRRDVLHQRLTTDTAMIRFVGNALVPSDFTRINEWVQKLKSWHKQGLKEVYFFTHEPDNLLAPELADYMVQQVQKELNAVVRGPKFLPKDGGQMALF